MKGEILEGIGMAVVMYFAEKFGGDVAYVAGEVMYRTLGTAELMSMEGEVDYKLEEKVRQISSDITSNKGKITIKSENNITLKSSNVNAHGDVIVDAAKNFYDII